MKVIIFAVALWCWCVNLDALPPADYGCHCGLWLSLWIMVVTVDYDCHCLWHKGAITVHFSWLFRQCQEQEQQIRLVCLLLVHLCSWESDCHPSIGSGFEDDVCLRVETSAAVKPLAMKGRSSFHICRERLWVESVKSKCSKTTLLTVILPLQAQQSAAVSSQFLPANKTVCSGNIITFHIFI